MIYVVTGTELGWDCVICAGKSLDSLMTYFYKWQDEVFENEDQFLEWCRKNNYVVHETELCG